MKKDQTGISQSPQGMCPFMSGQLAPVDGPGTIQQPNQIKVAPISMSCLGQNCQLWDGAIEGCSFKFIGDYLSHIVDGVDCLSKSMQPPSPESGGSPLLRIAKALEVLVERGKK